jgi:adenylate kinase
MESIKPPKGLETAQNLLKVLDRYKDKQVLVVGVPCCGKSTILQHIPAALDMDKVLFPLLSEGEKEFALQRKFNPDTEKFEQMPYDDTDAELVSSFELSADVLRTLAEMRLKITPGQPQFATLVLPSDVIVYLKIDDELLRKRVALRAAQNERAQQYSFVKKIEKLLEQQLQEAKDSGTVVEEFPMGHGVNEK